MAGLLIGSPDLATPERQAASMPIDPTELTKSIGAIGHEPQWGELGRVLAGEGICAGLSAPVEVDGSAIGTLDIYSSVPWDWDDSEMTALQTYAGLAASLLMAAVTAHVKGQLADQLQAALEHRWLIEQAKGLVMGREGLDAQAAFERLRQAARSSSRRLADVASEVTAGKPLPPANRPQRRPSPLGQAGQHE